MQVINSIDDFFTESIVNVYIDFESYYDSECSLSHLNTVEYISHPEFEVIGAAISINDCASRWVVGEDALRKVFSKIPWGRTRMISHNVPFDGAVLRIIFGHVPALYFCTMQGSRVEIVPFSHSMSLDKTTKFLNMSNTKGSFLSSVKGRHLADLTEFEVKALGEYSVNDLDLCRGLYRFLAPRISADDQLMLHLTCCKTVIPRLALDLPLLERALEVEVARKQTALRNAGIDLATIMSNAKFAAALTRLGVSPPMKVSPTTGKATLAFAKKDPEFLALLGHPNEDVRLLVQARLDAKSTIEESRLSRFLSVGTLLGGVIPFPLRWYAAMTGRNGGEDKLNMQNLTKGSSLRMAIMAPPGHRLVVSDLSQIEARMVAWLAGQEDLIEDFANGVDVYCKFGTATFGRTVTKEDKVERFIAKIGVLSLMYCSGAVTFCNTVNLSGVATISMDVAEQVVRSYRATYHRIPALWKFLDRMLDAMIRGETVTYKCLTFTVDAELTMLSGKRTCVVLLPGGRKLIYPELYVDANGEKFYRGNKGEWKKLYGGALLENISQALAQIVIRDAELRVAAATSLQITAVGQVHDELIYCVPDKISERFSAYLTKMMIKRPEWAPELPLACETEVGIRYGDAK